jgi:fibronectin type 3 domain-containing protein
MSAQRVRASTAALSVGVLLIVFAGCQRKLTDTPHPVTLSWHPSTSAVIGYHVYRADNPYGLASPLGITAPTITQYTDATAKSGHTYVYFVTAINSNHAESVASNQITVMTPDK